MRRLNCLLAFLTLVVAAPAAAEPVAMITDLTGRASVTVGGKAEAATVLAYLDPGTRLRLEAGAKLVLTFFNPALEVTLTGAAEATVGDAGVTMQKGAAPAQRQLDPGRADTARRFEPVQREKLALATVHMRGSTRPQIIIEGPANTSVWSTTPVLAWDGIPDVTEYRVTVSDSAGRTVLETRVAGTTLELDAGAGLRHGESYDWRVEGQLPGGTAVFGKANFSIVEANRAGRIAAARPAAGAPFSQRLLFAARLQGEGLDYEARLAWRALAAERPDDPMLREWADR